MQQNIDITDRYTVKFHKPIWNDNEMELAACLSISFKDGCYICDIRLTNKKALIEFLNACFPSIMLSNDSAQFRGQLFPQLKKMYSDLYQEFLDTHYSKLGYDLDLYDHQKEAIAEMMYRKVNLLAFEQGLGKTNSAASISKILKIKRTIIICPTLVKWNWFEDQTKKWNYDPLLWTILDAKKSKCLYAFLMERFVVINYEMIEKYFKYLTKSNVGHIIIDEAHMVKNVGAKRTKSVIKLIKHFPNVRVTLLTGTPYTNRIIDMYAYLKIADHPLGKSITRFKDEYAISTSMRGGKIVGAKNVDDLRAKISNFMIRRKASECLDLPDLIIKNFYFDVGELSKEYSDKLDEIPVIKNEIDDLKDPIEILEEENNIKRIEFNEIQESLSKEDREVYQTIPELSELRSVRKKLKMKVKGNIHTLNRLASESKVQPIIKLIDSLHEQGKKVIVFSGYTNPLLMLQEHYRDKSVLINGSVGAHKRQGLIDRYKSDPNCNVFLGNFKAAGVGINLVNSNHVIFMNFPFTPDDLEQPYKRAHRIGQKEKVHVYYTLGRGTIDERVYEIIKDKAGDINSLIDDNKNVVNYGSLEGQLFKSLIAEYHKKKGIVTNEDATGFVSVK